MTRDGFSGAFSLHRPIGRHSNSQPPASSSNEPCQISFYNRFTEGFATVDLKDAKMLLDLLA